MPDRTRKPKRPADANRRAWEIVQEAIGEEPEKEEAALVRKALEEGKDPAAALLGRKGGKKGGRARADRLSPEERSEIARLAANARWMRQRQKDVEE